MKQAFITTYSYGEVFRPNNCIAINNGFSFVDHLFKNHEHFFLNISDKTINQEIIRIKKEIENFDVIYLSTISLFEDFYKLFPLIDSRFIIGGPGIQELKVDKISKITGAKFHKTSFESYLNVPVQETFTEYWIDYFGDYKLYDFNINHLNYCPNKCTFCTYSSPEKIKRNLEDILLKIINNKNPKFITLSSPTQSIESLEILKKHYNKIKDSNTFLWAYIRADDAIIDFLNTFDDLENLELSNGLEYFSNDCLKRINKHTTVENSLRLADMALKKRGKVSFSIIGNSPIFSENDLIESIKNYELFNRLFTNENNLFFRAAKNLYFINDKESLLKMTNRFIIKKLPDLINDNEILYADSNSTEDKINNKIFEKNVFDITKRSYVKLNKKIKAHETHWSFI